MDWLEAVVHTTTMGADIVSDVLMNAGAVGTAIEDRYDVTSSKKSDGMWDMIDEDVLKHMSEDVLVKAYFKSDASAPETLHLVEQKLGEIAKMDMGFDMGSLTLDTQGVREQDWAENWKKYYKPFRAGERLVIKPSWEAYEPKDGDLVLELDPGMAFGTGTHETTFMCMEQLEKYVTPGCRAIDVGCGSGILGLAAAKLGAADVLAIDLDELAVKVAAENTEKNGLSNVVRVAHGDLLEKREEKADVIVANIIADVICYLCGPVKKHLLEGGTFICSGIIDGREDEYRWAGPYMVSRQVVAVMPDSDIETLADLAGKTIYAPGQGANPEYILRYVLTGNGLDPETLHPYMWLCKGHYYSTLSFYNFPYAFGGLFARGLYEKYMQEGAAFVPVYRKLLYATPVCTVEDTAKVAGIDLTDKKFWENSMLSYRHNVDEFERLSKKLNK